MHRILLALAMLACAAPSLVSAQGSANDPRRAEARRLLETGQTQYEAHQYAESAATYMQAYDLLTQMGNNRAPLALWNAGHALSYVPGREAEARETLQRFLRESNGIADDAGVRDDRSHAVTLIGELETRIAASGGGGAQTQQEPADTSSESQAEAQPTTPARTEPGMSPVGPIILGVGGAALLAGAILGGYALSEGDRIRNVCMGDSACFQREGASNIETLSITTDVLLFGGAAIAVTGLILMFVLKEGGSAERAALSCGPNGCIASLTGDF